MTPRHQPVPEQTQRIVSSLDGAIILHEMDSVGAHRLVVNNSPGNWTTYEHIALKGDYAATTMYYMGALPEVFAVKALLEHAPR